jgi:hypothetical protein
MARTKQTSREYESRKAPFLLPFKRQKTNVTSAGFLDSAEEIVCTDTRIIATESSKLMKKMTDHLTEVDTKIEAGFKPNAQLIHNLFEIAATVSTIAQVDEDDIPHLDAIRDHAIRGMRIVEAGDD